MKLIGLILLLTGLCSAHAERPAIEQITGQPVRAIWSNGNKAVLHFMRSPVNQVAFNLRVTENLCVSRNGDITKATLHYRHDTLTWLWEANSDPSLVGHSVANASGEVPFFWKIVTNDDSNLYPDLARELPRDRLEFSNLNWLPGFDSGSLQSFTLSAWMSEGSVKNSQTGVVENRIVSGAHGVHFKAGGGLTAEIESSNSVFNMSYGYFSMLGNGISWLWQNANGPCQITFNTSMTTDESNIVIETYYATLKEPLHPYLAGQDSLLQSAGPSFIEKLNEVQ